MPERREEREISQETRDLIEDLGRRLSAESRERADALSVEPSRLSAMRAQSEPRGVLEDKFRDIEEQLQHARGEVARLEEMRDYLRRQMHEERLSYGDTRGRLAASKPLVGPIPDYLQPLREAIERGVGGAFWLHGEDARERRRAVESASDILIGIRGWVPAHVDFSRRFGNRRSSAPPFTSGITDTIREVWEVGGRTSPLDRDQPGRKPFSPRMRYRHALSRQSFGARDFRGNVAIILSEFPSRRLHAGRFLDWLQSEMQMVDFPALIVSSEGPPPSESPEFQAIFCESRAAKFGKRLATLRIEKGLNRANLAEASGVSSRELAMLEAGVQDEVDPAVIKRLFDALGVRNTDLGSP